MQTVHVKNIEKYHPNYKDRELIWCKVYFTMLNGDPKFEMLCEIDQWRFIKFIMLEIQSKHPVPIEQAYLTRKGFDLMKRPISLTLQMLHEFIEVCDVEKRREDKEEKRRGEEEAVTATSPQELFETYKKTVRNLSQPRELTHDREHKCRLRLRERGLSEWQTIFERMDKTPFLLGKNQRGWSASFDWIIANESNAVKVLEGKYDDSAGGASGKSSLERYQALREKRANRDPEGASSSG